jgi:hypothetical protein
MTKKPIGIKFDGEKPDYSLIPPFALDEVTKVLTFGTAKYARDNWRKVDNGKIRYFSAAMRHMWALMRGESHDTETGLHHSAHAICCMMFYFEFDMNKNHPLPKK